MSKEYINFYDYCESKGYKNILNSYKGNKNNLKTYSINSHKAITFKCEKCGDEYQREVRVAASTNIDRAYCKKCGQHEFKTGRKVKKAQRTLYDWLQNEGVKYSITLENEAELEKAKHLSINSNEKKSFKCLVHEQSYEKEIYRVCYSKYCKLDCCKQCEFTFQDWYLLFYDSAIKVYVSDRYRNLREKVYTGKQARKYYFNAETNNNTLLVGRTAQDIFEEEPYNSKQEIYLKCDNNRFKPETIKIYRVTKGISWCESSCRSCDGSNIKIKKEASIEKFLELYSISNKNNAEIKKLRKKIDDLEKKFNQGILFTTESEQDLSHAKEELSTMQKGASYITNKLLKEININRKKYTKKIIAILESENYL